MFPPLFHFSAYQKPGPHLTVETIFFQKWGNWTVHAYLSLLSKCHMKSTRRLLEFNLFLLSQAILLLFHLKTLTVTALELQY